MSYAHRILNVIEAIESMDVDNLDAALDSLYDYAFEYELGPHDWLLLADLKARCDEDIEEQEEKETP